MGFANRLRQSRGDYHRYLSRAKGLQRDYGYSVIEYFNKIKIGLPKELLVEEDKKVKEAAGALGFTDRFFSRIFKKSEVPAPPNIIAK